MANEVRYPNHTDDHDVRERARDAILRGDRVAALALLRDVAEGSVDGSDIDAASAETLVSFATEKHDAHDAGRVARWQAAETAAHEVLDLLAAYRFQERDLLEMRQHIDNQLARRQGEDAGSKATLAHEAGSARRLGTGTIEAKMISNGHSAKLYGPYLYARFWSEGRYRSRYIGKVTE